MFYKYVIHKHTSYLYFLVRLDKYQTDKIYQGMHNNHSLILAINGLDLDNHGKITDN